MKKLGYAAAAGAALLTAASPALAAAAPAAARLSFANVAPRVGAPVDAHGNKLFGLRAVWLVLLGAAIAGGIFLIVDSNNDNNPVSA